MAGGNQSAEHSNLVNAIRIALGLRHDVLTWKVQSGGYNPIGSKQVVKTGKGKADIAACVFPGLHLELEVKTGEAVQNEDQKNWEAAIVRRGGFYFVVRSVEEAIHIVDKLKDIHIERLKKLGLI